MALNEFLEDRDILDQLTLEELRAARERFAQTLENLTNQTPKIVIGGDVFSPAELATEVRQGCAIGDAFVRLMLEEEAEQEFFEES